MTADVVFTNAQFLTMDPGLPIARSIRVSDGRIRAVSASEVDRSGASVIDLDGATVTPGLHDVHAHSVWFGLSLIELNLASVTSLDELYGLVATAAAQLGPDEWVVATEFSHLTVGGAYPDRDRLDRASGGRPVWIKHNSGHACVVSSAALSQIEERSDMSVPIAGGVVVRDDAGRPTGLLEENAMRLVQELRLPYAERSIVRALDLATARYVSEGLTSVTDAGIGGGWIGHSPLEFGAYQRARDEGVLRTRMQPMFSIDALHGIAGHADDGDRRSLGGGMRTGFGDDRLRLGPVKIFSDGSLLGSTAAMSEPYAGCTHNHGYLQASPEDLRAWAIDAARAGWSLAVHAIGDRAVDHAIEIIAEAHLLFGRPSTPHRIEHAGVVRDDQLSALAKERIVVTPQPFFIRAFGDGLADRLGPARVPMSYRGKSFLEHGIPLPGSSDRPVADGAPLRGIQAFVERTTASGLVYGEAERLSPLEALAAYTLGSAEATGVADRLGSLSVGKLADLTILAERPDRVAPAQISAIEVLGTVIDGEFALGGDKFPGADTFSSESETTPC